MTKYKKEILNIINTSYSHMTADDIYKKVKEKYPNIVLATIYNNLNALVDEELIRKISVEGNIDRYDNIIKHDHLVCKKCGKIIDINFKDYSSELSKLSGMEIISYDLKAFIICDDCKTKKN